MYVIKFSWNKTAKLSKNIFQFSDRIKVQQNETSHKNLHFEYCVQLCSVPSYKSVNLYMLDSKEM